MILILLINISSHKHALTLTKYSVLFHDLFVDFIVWVEQIDRIFNLKEFQELTKDKNQNKHWYFEERVDRRDHIFSELRPNSLVQYLVGLKSQIEIKYWIIFLISTIA